MDQEWEEKVPEIYGTYQNFVWCPSYFGFHWPGGQYKPRPHFLDQSISASHLQRVHQARHLCQNWQLRVNDTSFVENQVLCKRMLTITYYKRTRSDFLPLTLQFILTRWISVEIQHAPPRCFQTQALITGKVTTALVMPRHFMTSICEHRHILPARPTVKMAWHFGSLWWPCHKEPAKLGCRVHLLHSERFLGQIFPAPFASVCLISADVWRLNPLWSLRWSLLQPVQHFIQFCQQKNGYCRLNTKPLNPRKAENTYYSSRETAVVLSPPHELSDIRTPSDD